jgi:hypothetical protein
MKERSSLRFGLSDDWQGAFRRRGFAKHITKSVVSASRKKLQPQRNCRKETAGRVRQAAAVPQNLT